MRVSSNTVVCGTTKSLHDECRFRTCFKGPSGKYAYLSADGHQVLIQVDIQKSLKFVSGVAVGTVMVNMLPDPVNNSRLFFYDSDSEGSIVFAFEVTEAVNDGLDLKYKIIFASLGAFTLIFAVLAVIIAMVSRLFKKSNKIDPLRSSLLDKLPSPSSYRLAEWEIDLDSLQFDEIIHEGPNSVIFRGVRFLTCFFKLMLTLLASAMIICQLRLRRLSSVLMIHQNAIG